MTDETPIESANSSDAVAAQSPAASPHTEAAGAPSNVNHSAEVAELMTRLAAAQGEIRNPGLEGVNPHFQSRYANLASGIIAVRAALSKHGIVYSQVVKVSDGLMMLYTRLWHKEQWIETEWPIARFGAMSQQQLGSAHTYARRYSLFSIVGIVGATDDDDGEAASGAPAIPANYPITADQSKELMELIAETNTETAAFLKWAGVKSIPDLTQKAYADGKAFLEAKKRK